MLLCAGTMLINVWATEKPTEFGFRIAGTFFILGFASFLIWAPSRAYRFLE